MPIQRQHDKDSSYLTLDLMNNWTLKPAWRNDLLHAKHSLSSLFTFLTPRIAFTGLAAFEPGRISDNFMKRFDSPTVNEEVPVSRPKKKLISFDQVMRRVSIIHASLKMIHMTYPWHSSLPDTFVHWGHETATRCRVGRDQECQVTTKHWQETKRFIGNISRKSWCPPDDSELSFNKVIFLQLCKFLKKF